MSAYRSDPRTRRLGQRLEFECDGVRFAVLRSDHFGWSVWVGPDLALVSEKHKSEDDAVASILGDPQ